MTGRPGSFRQRRKQPRQGSALINIRGPVQSRHEILSPLRRVRPKTRRAQPVRYWQAGVSITYSYEKDPLLDHPRRLRFSLAASLVVKKPVCDRIGHHPVDLLGHAPISRTNTRFDVRNRDSQLLCRNRAGMVEVTSPTTKQSARAPRAPSARSASYRRRLLGLSSGANFQIHVRFRNSQLRKESPDIAGVVNAGRYATSRCLRLPAQALAGLQGSDDGVQPS